MKIKVYVFLLIALLVTGLAPAINLTQRVMDRNFKNLGWRKLASLYTVDWVMQGIGKKAYAYGISVSPQNAVIGKDGWLFLGDSQTNFFMITNKRLGASPARTDAMMATIDRLSRWGDWFKAQGVKEFRFMIGPDKASIYPEYEPDWSAPAKRQLSDVVRDRAPPDLYVDLFTPLRAARRQYGDLLYYRTDTHWNNLGAWIAFESMAKNLGAAQKDLVWPDPALGEIASVDTRNGGDLTRFIYVERQATDHNVVLKFAAARKPVSVFSDFQSGQEIPAENPAAKYGLPIRPFLARTADALNRKKLLWIQDSFGVAMTPLMRATFSDILHVHPGRTNRDELIRFVKAFQPDYVLITNVERSIPGWDFYDQSPP